jgi:uncharacterized membrane protein YfcA
MGNIAGGIWSRHKKREMRMPLIFVVVGLAAGVLSGLFGIGGGVLIVPALIFFAKLQPVAATGTSLGALLLPVGALGAYEYYKRGNLNIPASLWVAVGLFFGAWVGAKLAQQMSPVQLKRAFSVFLVLVAGKLWFS